jgi:hypothetical protein
MTYMRSWKSHRLTSHTWLGLNPQIGRLLSRIVVPLVYFLNIKFMRFEIPYHTKKLITRKVSDFLKLIFFLNLYSYEGNSIPKVLLCLGIQSILKMYKYEIVCILFVDF